MLEAIKRGIMPVPMKREISANIMPVPCWPGMHKIKVVTRNFEWPGIARFCPPKIYNMVTPNYQVIDRIVKMGVAWPKYPKEIIFCVRLTYALEATRVTILYLRHKYNPFRVLLRIYELTYNCNIYEIKQNETCTHKTICHIYYSIHIEPTRNANTSHPI